MFTCYVINYVFFLSFFIVYIEGRLTFQHVPFNKWAENSSDYKLSTLSLPSSQYVIVSNTNLEGCETIVSCKILLNEFLWFNNDLPEERRISNFYISSNGYIFSGHEWNSRVNPFYCNNQSYIEITLIANTAFSVLTPVQIRAAQRILEYGLLNGFLTNSYTLFGEWILRKEGSPWSLINQNLISMWPHWSP